MAKPKTIGAIFSTIWNEAKGLGKCLAGNHRPAYKVSAVIGFVGRTVGNLVVASAIGIKSALTSKSSKQHTERLKQHSKKLAKQRREAKKRAKQSSETKTPANQQPAESAKPAKVRYTTDAKRIAIANTQALYEKKQKAGAEKKERITDSRLPKPYRAADEGEYVHTLRCVNIGCDGGGNFQIADGKLLSIRRDRGNDPANCYTCRLLKYNAQQAECVTGNCEVCGEYVSKKSEDWIGYHKFKGKPTFTLFCNTCKHNRRLEQQADHDRQITLSYRGNREGIREFGLNHEKENVRKEARRLQLQSKLSRCTPITASDLIDIADIQKPSHFYHTHPVKGESGMESAFMHIQHHFDGTNGKTPSMQDFVSVYGIIRYAHEIAQINDPSRIIDSDEGSDYAIIKVDLEKGIKLVYHKIGDKWMLKTAFRKDEIEGEIYFNDRESAVRFANEILGKKTSQYNNPQPSKPPKAKNNS